MQDYADFGGFTFPVHIHVNAITRVIGRALVDIYHRDYRPVSADANSAEKKDEVSDRHTAKCRHATQSPTAASLHGSMSGARKRMLMHQASLG
jgi:hypothetical protein